jgi:hypothetical protein
MMYLQRAFKFCDAPICKNSFFVRFTPHRQPESRRRDENPECQFPFPKFPEHASKEPHTFVAPCEIKRYSIRPAAAVHYCSFHVMGIKWAWKELMDWLA